MIQMLKHIAWRQKWKKFFDKSHIGQYQNLGGSLYPRKNWPADVPFNIIYAIYNMWNKP